MVLDFLVLKMILSRHFLLSKDIYVLTVWQEYQRII